MRNKLDLERSQRSGRKAQLSILITERGVYLNLDKILRILYHVSCFINTLSLLGNAMEWNNEVLKS